LVGLKQPGVRTVQVDGAQVEIAIADQDDFAPVGPLSSTPPQSQSTLGSQLPAAHGSAQVLLTLAALDPSLTSDHLSTWATDAVAMVTAGRSSWTKVHAVGELIRLAGVRLTGAVVVRADKWDESLGLTATPTAGRDPALGASAVGDTKNPGGSTGWRSVGR
jgi:hypothetical protein